MRVLETQRIYWRQYIKVDYHRQQNAAYRYLSSWDTPTAEGFGLNPIQCEFESHSQYMLVAQWQRQQFQTLSSGGSNPLEHTLN